MSKKALYFDQAEQLYIKEQCTFKEIAKKMPVSERAIRSWGKLGNWEKKRMQYLKSKQAYHEELYEFSRKIMHSVEEDLERESIFKSIRKNVNTALLTTMTNNPADLTWDKVISTLEEAEFTIEDFLLTLKYAIEGDIKIDAGRLYFLKNITPLIGKVKSYEDAATKKELPEKEAKKGLSEDVIKQIERQIFGM